MDGVNRRSGRAAAADARQSPRQWAMRVYQRLEDRYGPQRWWPADTPFEVMVGAVLTQATAWTNVEKAIANLKAEGALTPSALRATPVSRLAALLRPSGYYNVKTRRLQALAAFLGSRFDDDLEAVAAAEPDALRAIFLKVHGVGEETADAILLYALGMPFFVVDAYTRRLCSRLGVVQESRSYAGHAAVFSCGLPRDPGLYGEFHALIVRHGKEVCRRRPACAACCLLDMCPTGLATTSPQPGEEPADPPVRHPRRAAGSPAGGIAEGVEDHDAHALQNEVDGLAGSDV